MLVVTPQNPLMLSLQNLLLQGEPLLQPSTVEPQNSLYSQFWEGVSLRRQEALQDMECRDGGGSWAILG